MSLRSAVSFLTVIPVPRSEASSYELGRAWFPLVGGLVGAGAGATFWLTSLTGNRFLAAVAAVACLALLTGGLHLDAVADAADGIFGGSTPERRLEIMRDSRIGSFGAVAVVLVVLAEVACLSPLEGLRGFFALIASGVLSRSALLGMTQVLPYVRSDGLGAGLGPPALGSMMGTIVAAALIPFLGWLALWALVAALAGAGVVGLVARQRIGGATGDVYGAACEIAQVVVLAVMGGMHG